MKEELSVECVFLSIFGHYMSSENAMGANISKPSNENNKELRNNRNNKSKIITISIVVLILLILGGIKLYASFKTDGSENQKVY